MNDGRIQNPSKPVGIVPLSRFVLRGFGVVHHSIAILYHEVPNPNLTIRNLSSLAPGRGARPAGRGGLLAAGQAAANLQPHTGEPGDIDVLYTCLMHRRVAHQRTLARASLTGTVAGTHRRSRSTTCGCSCCPTTATLTTRACTVCVCTVTPTSWISSSSTTLPELDSSP